MDMIILMKCFFHYEYEFLGNKAEFLLSKRKRPSVFHFTCITCDVFSKCYKSVSQFKVYFT